MTINDIIQNNIAEIALVEKQIINHPICKSFDEDEYFYHADFGRDYLVHGCKSAKGMGKVNALVVLLRVCDDYYNRGIVKD